MVEQQSSKLYAEVRFLLLLIIFFKKKNNLIFAYKINLKLNDYIINYFKFKNLPLCFFKKPKNLNNKFFFKNTNNYPK